MQDTDHIKSGPPGCIEVYIPIELDPNEAIKTQGLEWNPSSDLFLIIKETCIQNLRVHNSLLLVKVLFLLLLQLYLTHWA